MGSRLVTARARSLPLLTCGMAVPAMAKAKSVSPRTSEIGISTEPLNGTCTASAFSSVAKVAPPRCAAEPMPPDA
ncbi:hypothetical protein D3C72_1935540 [compost metagenome]